MVLVLTGFGRGLVGLCRKSAKFGRRGCRKEDAVVGVVMEVKLFGSFVSVENDCCRSSFLVVAIFNILLVQIWIQGATCRIESSWADHLATQRGAQDSLSHSCIHDEILQQRRQPGKKEYSVTPQVYQEGGYSNIHREGRSLLEASETEVQQDIRQPIRIYLNYDAVGHSPDRDCRRAGDIVKLGEPPISLFPGNPTCNPHGDPPVLGDCWYNCTTDDVTGEDKKRRLRKALGQTADWFRRALSVEPVKGNLRLSGYSACGQDGGVQLPREYVEEGVADADLVLLVTTRPTTGNTLAWAVACERDQWGRAIAGHVNVAPRHLTAEAESLLSATLIHEVMHVLGFDPHAFAHFRDERKRRRTQVTAQVIDEKLGRLVTRVVLPHVVMYSRHHYGVTLSLSLCLSVCCLSYVVVYASFRRLLSTFCYTALLSS